MGSDPRTRLRRRTSSLFRAENLEIRRLLSTATWSNASGGSWSTAADWSTKTVPQPGDDVVINQPGNIQISLGSSAQVKSFTIVGDSLVLSGGAVLAATGAVNNSGTITVNSGAQLEANGAYTESAGATLSLPGSSSGGDPTPDELANTGFESPVTSANGSVNPGIWTAWGTAYLSKKYALSGLQSLQTNGVNSGVDQSFSVTPGAAYTVSAYAMTPAADPLSGSEEGFIELLFYTSGKTLISSYSAPNDVAVLTASSPPGGPLAGTVGDQGWNHYGTTAIAPRNAASVNVLLGVGNYNGVGASGGSVYWDAPSFGQLAAGTSNVTAGSIVNSGLLTVGPSASLKSVTTFAQMPAGTLDVQIGGTPSSDVNGSVVSSGAASLAGTFESDLVFGYTPATTDVFTVMQFPSETGGFSNWLLAGSSSAQFQGAVTFTNVVLASEPTALLTATVNSGSDLGEVNTNLLGTNIDWWDANATSAQTQQLAEQAGLSLFRFPAGSSADVIHFNISTNQLPNVSSNPSPTTVPQFAQFIQAAGGTGIVTLDYGSGSPQEAAAEMAYLLGSTSDTTSIGSGIEWNLAANAWQNDNWGTVGYWAGLRVAAPLATDDGLNFLRIGHVAPFTNIKYWEVGNEEYGSFETDHHGTVGPGSVSTGAQHDPATYVTFAESFANFAAEIAASSGIPAISIGIDSDDPTGASDNNWSRNVLADGAAVGFIPGFISDHNYVVGPGSENDATLLNSTVSNPGSSFDWSLRYARYESILQQTVPAQASGVSVMATEFNSVYVNPGKQSISLVNGLFIADSIGSLLSSGYSGGLVWDLRNNGYQPGNNNSEALYGWRNGGDYGLFGNPAVSNPPTTSAYVPYPNYFGEQLASEIVQAGGEVESVSSNYQDFHAYAVKEADGHLDLLVINTNPAASLAEQFNISGFQPSGAAQLWQYGEAQDTAQSQSSTGASALSNFSATLGLTGSNFSYTFPAYSMTVIDLAPAPVSTTSMLNSSNPSTIYGQPVTFTATVTPASGSNETGTVQFLIDGMDVGNAVALSGNTATYTTSSISVGNHSIAAVYSGDANFAGSTSASITQNIAPLTVTSVTPNGDNPALAGTQQSMVDSLVYTFSGVVNLSAGAFTIGVATGSTGTPPALDFSAVNPAGDGSSAEWIVTFSGTGVVGGSIADGRYTIDFNSVFALAGTADSSYNFFRLFGDTNGDGIVNNLDVQALRTAYATSVGEAGYDAALDAFAAGTVNNQDVQQFRLRYGTAI